MIRDPTKLSPQAELHKVRLEEAFAAIREAMHNADGSNPPGEHQAHEWSGQNMVIAAIYIDIAEMFALKSLKWS